MKLNNVLSPLNIRQKTGFTNPPNFVKTAATVLKGNPVQFHREKTGAGPTAMPYSPAKVLSPLNLPANVSACTGRSLVM